jgi:signal transduction histidine kinase
LEARTAELTRSVQELKVLGEVGQAVSSTLDLENRARHDRPRVLHQLAGMDAGAIYEYDEARREFYLHTADRLEDEVVTALRAGPIRQGEGALGRMAMTREPAQIRDIMTDASYQRPLRDTVLRLGYRSLMAVPLMRDDHLLGGLVVYRKTAGDFDAPLIKPAEDVRDAVGFGHSERAAVPRDRGQESRTRSGESAQERVPSPICRMMLRTPLNAIIGFSEFCPSACSARSTKNRPNTSMTSCTQGKHLLSLINDILDLSKIEAGRMELELSEFRSPEYA